MLENQNENDYAEFLFNTNKIKGVTSLEFILKSSQLQNKYDNVKFWQLPDKEAFIFLLNEIVKGDFDINDILYILSEQKILSGFNEYILDYISSKKINSEAEAKRLEKLAKIKQIDALIIELIKQEFYADKDAEALQKQK